MKHYKIYFSIMLVSLVISLAVISISHGATLTWNPNSEDDLAGYKLSFGVSSEKYLWSRDVGNVTKYDIPPSWPADEYYVAIKAYDASTNYSEFSSELEFVIYPSEGDADFDGIPDDEDNCPDDYNSEQEDNDDDKLGDVCDPDDDNDGVDDIEDNCPDTANGGLGTCRSGYSYFIGVVCIADHTCGAGGFCSMDQEDTDSDGLGDVCDPDADGDGILNDQDDCPFDSANDIDNDGVCGDVDNCPDHYNPHQEDTYPLGGNGCGDACECLGDFNGDGQVDGVEAIMFKENFWRDDCSELLPCNGDFDCDGKVGPIEAIMFKGNFMRSDCPNNCGPSGGENWCEY